MFLSDCHRIEEITRVQGSGSLVSNAISTAVFSINSSGDVTGSDETQNKTRGFERDAKGNITVFDAPNAFLTSAVSINASGDGGPPVSD